MKMKLLFIALFSIVNFNLSAQDAYLQETSNDDLDSITKSLTNEYSKKLSLTGKQDLLFKKKVEEFLIKKNEIENSLKGKEKLDALYKVGQQENREMRDLLTREQYDLYLRIKPSIQPLEKVKMKK